MKTFSLFILLIIASFSLKAQTCSEVAQFVRSKSYGTTYTSYNSDAISKVTFYQVMVDYKTLYFAIVCFKKKYSGCSEYIYQVGSNTKLYYSMNYLNSAGKAFWEYIQPYNKNLGCGIDL